MCVIAICDHARLTDEQVHQMWDQNKHGGGIAWREKDATGKVVVKWRKGLKEQDMLDANKFLPRPYILHFRVPSHDTSSSQLACHPFPIDENATLGFEGQTEGFVLFHNGFWGDWRNKLQTIALNGYCWIPSGPWSDSRGLAWAAHHLGLGILEMANEKVVAFGPGEDDIEIFGSWLGIKNPDEEGVEQTLLVSNKAWERSYPTTFPQRNHGDYTSTDKRRTSITDLSKTTDQGGSAADGGTFRTAHGVAQDTQGGWQDKQQSVSQKDEESTASTQQGTGQEVDDAGNRALMLTGGELVSCAGCKKRTRTVELFDTQLFCWQCWALKVHGQHKVKPRVGFCQTCRVNRAGMKRFVNDEWICHTCWETNGTPKVYMAALGRMEPQ